MPGKTGRSKRKQSQLGKNKGSRVSSAATVKQSPASPPEASTPSEALSAPVAPSRATPAAPAHYPYIYSELRRIGILAVIILAILVVLSLVLS